MVRFLSNLLSIKPNEWDGVLYFFLISLVFAFGASFARSVGMALLTSHLSDKLPIIFILIDLSVMVGSMIYAHYTKRVTGAAILSFFFLSTAVFALIVQGLFLFGDPHVDAQAAKANTDHFLNWVYGFFFVGFSFFNILIAIHFGSVVASYFNAVQVKRVTPLINAGTPIGGILGGSMLMMLSSAVPPQWLIIMLAIACLGAYSLLKVVSRNLSPVRAGIPSTRSSHHSPVDELVAAFKYIIRSRLMIFMSLALVFFVIGNKLLEYQYQIAIYHEIYPDTVERTQFFAKYEIFANLAWLLIQVLFTSRIMTAIGVGASNLLYPVLSAVVGLSLFLYFYWTAQGQFSENATIMLTLGIVAQFINQEMRQALRTPANNLLFNAIPPNQWGINKAFLNGIVFPFSTVVASSFLLLITSSSDSVAFFDFSKEELSYILPLIALTVSILGIIVAIPQWAAYNDGVFGLLNRELFDRRASSNFSGNSKSNLLRQVIEEKLRSDDYYHVIAALEMIRVTRLSYFATQIGNLLLKTKSFQIKEHCVNTLAELPQTNTTITYLIESLKTDQDPHVLPLILRNLSQFKAVNLNTTIEKMLEHPSAEVFVEACLCLYNHPLYSRKQYIENLLLERLKVEQNETRLSLFLYAIGELKQAHFHNHVLPYINVDDPDLSLAALTAYIRMLEGQLEAHKDLLIEALNSPVKEMKIASLRALKECQPLENWTPIIRLLGAKDRVLVNESKELLRLSLSHCKSALVIRVFSESVSVQERFEILSLVYPRLSDQQRQRLRKSADDALRKFLQINALLCVHEQMERKSKVHDLVAKILHEVAEMHLQHVLTVITYASEQSLDFFQRVSRGLLSMSKANQGNALEVLSNAGEKFLVGRVLKYYEERPTDIKGLNHLHLVLFSEPLSVNEGNYEAHLLALDHDLLRACLHYVQQERTGSSTMERSTSRRVREYLSEGKNIKPFRRLARPAYRPGLA